MLIVVRCRVCHHAKRSSIELACVATPLAEVAARFGLSESALERHVRDHQIEEAPPTSRSPGSGPVIARVPDRRIAHRLGEALLEVLRSDPEARREVLALFGDEAAA